MYSLQKFKEVPEKLMF